MVSECFKMYTMFSYYITVSTSTIGSAGGSRRRSRGTPTKQAKTGPFILKGKLYFNNKEEVPALTAPKGFVFPGPMQFYVNNQTGLKTLYYAVNEDAADGVGIGALRSTPAGKVFIDIDTVYHESEIIFGVKMSLDDVIAMLDFEAVASAPVDESTTAGMESLDIKDEN